MATRIIMAFAASLFSAALETIPQAVDPAEIVRRHYPMTRLAPEDDDAKRECFAVRDVDAQGGPVRIVAGYTDFSTAVVRVLTRTAPGRFRVTYETPREPRLDGTGCDITLLDFDGDGQRDVFVELALGRHSAGLVFRWKRNGLENVSPSDLLNPFIVDIRHDGTLQVVAQGSDDRDRKEDEKRSAPSWLYRFADGRYVFDEPVLLVTQVSVGDPEILTHLSLILAEDLSGPYVLRIVNGDAQKRRRVTGATVKLNGVVIAGGTQINERVEFLDVPLGSFLPIENKLDVEVQGPAGGFITIVVKGT